MALLGVTLAVASIVSVHLISTTIVERLDRLLPEQLLSYSHFLHYESSNKQAVLNGYFVLRERWRLGSLPEIDQVGPIIDETLVINGRAIRLLGLDLLGGPGVRAADTDPDTDLGAAAETSSWQGVWASADLIDSAPAPVNGVLEGAEALLLADIGVAQALLEWPDTQISYVAVRFASTRHAWRRVAERILPGFGAGLPRTKPESPLANWTIREFSEQNPTAEFGRSVLFNISALAMLALLVSWFLIYQVAVSWLRRLWSTFERLHVLGVARWQLSVAFVGMLGGVGLFAGILGIYIGQWLGEFLYGVALGTLEGASPALEVDRWVVGKALVSALLVCIAGGLWAYRNKTLDEYGDERGDERGSIRLRNTRQVWLASLILAIALGVAALGVFVEAAGLVGAFTAIAIVSLLVALCAKPVLIVLRRRAAALSGPYLVRLGLRETVWYPQELSVALGGLVLAVATAIGVSLMVDSFRSDFEKLLERRLSYHFAVSGPAAPLAEALNWLGSQHKVSAERDPDAGLRVDGFWRESLRVAGLPVEVVRTPLGARQAARYGVERALESHEVLVSEQFVRAVRKHSGESLAIGDSLVFGNQDQRIAGVFGSFGDLQPRVILPLGMAPRGVLYSVNVAVNNPAFAEALLDDLRNKNPDLLIQRQAEIKRQALDAFDQTFAITSVLITISMLVAGIGVYVSVTTLRLNRSTSTRLLHTLGVSRLEVLWGDLSRALGFGLLAVLLAIPLGFVLGWILCAVVNPRAFGWVVQLSPSASAIMGPVFWGVLAAIIAGTLRLGSAEEGNLDARNA